MTCVIFHWSQRLFDKIFTKNQTPLSDHYGVQIGIQSPCRPPLLYLPSPELSLYTLEEELEGICYIND